MTIRDLLQIIAEADSLDNEVFLGPALRPLDFVECVNDPHPLVKPYIVLHTGDDA